MTVIATLLFATGATFACAPLVLDMAARTHQKPRMDQVTAAGVQCIGDVLLVAANVLTREWLWAAAFLAAAIFQGIRWWRRRKKRRALAALGNKARARIEAMKQAMRERAKPRPLLRPQRSPA